MEKYGVAQDEEQVKTGAAARPEPKQCPRCSRPLASQDETGIRLCYACGSEPFEKGEAK